MDIVAPTVVCKKLLSTTGSTREQMDLPILICILGWMGLSDHYQNLFWSWRSHGGLAVRCCLSVCVRSTHVGYSWKWSKKWLLIRKLEFDSALAFGFNTCAFCFISPFLLQLSSLWAKHILNSLDSKTVLFIPCSFVGLNIFGSQEERWMKNNSRSKIVEET